MKVQGGEVAVVEMLKIEASVNVFDEPLISCCENPMTGFFRDGCCNTNQQDFGSHTVCIEVTKAFLEYSRDRGVNLSTPNSDFDFPGLRAGDKWCMCALSWLETHDQHMAPRLSPALSPGNAENRSVSQCL